MDVKKVGDELLSKVSGGALSENDKDGIVCWLRTQKDMGFELDEVLEQFKNDFNNKIDYYDLIDTDGKPVGLDDLLGYVKQYWEEV
ncbi:MAG: hypothetical protein IKI61_08430 [Erysipelotrichaceae bacterium]|jgi:hypothetical protein|nr:hypothetical protein [Erysipelotrichaceae bacterium]MCR5095850.1 hypothetical protein [Erysipelotrichaceae bacterium]